MARSARAINGSEGDGLGEAERRSIRRPIMPQVAATSPTSGREGRDPGFPLAARTMAYSADKGGFGRRWRVLGVEAEAYGVERIGRIVVS